MDNLKTLLREFLLVEQLIKEYVAYDVIETDIDSTGAHIVFGDGNNEYMSTLNVGSVDQYGYKTGSILFGIIKDGEIDTNNRAGGDLKHANSVLFTVVDNMLPIATKMGIRLVAFKGTKDYKDGDDFSQRIRNRFYLRFNTFIINNL